MNRFLPIILITMLITALLLFTGCAGKETAESRIESFTATDMPYDNGTGVLLKWKPLDKSQRIIQYNIYRGYNADSLFFLSKIEVDAKLGVASEWLSFYDKDYIPLVEFETAPAKLSREKQQTATSTLYKAVPREAKTLAKFIPHYDILGDISSSKYYNASRRIEVKSKEDAEVYAGYKLTQFNNLYANPKRENTYYYCVVPVTETGKFLPASKVQAATPMNNRPDSTAVLYTAYIRDKNELRFEWSAPLASQDIYTWQVWLMPRSALPLFHAEQKANANAADSIFNAAWQQQSILVHSMIPSYAALVFYDKVNLTETGVAIPAEADFQKYIPVLTYDDYWASSDGSRLEMYSAAALGNPLVAYDYSQLPKLPDYSILDKENDKGDNLIISFGRPFAFVTLASYSNKAQTKMRINYEVSSNSHQSIDKLKFRFLDSKGKVFGEVKEQYLDKAVQLKLPEATKIGENFQVQVYSRLAGERDYGKDFIQQSIEYDPTAFRFSGSSVNYEGQVLNAAYYDVFSRNKLYPSFSPGMRIGALSRAYDQAIPYPATQMASILKYDPKSNLLLADHHFAVSTDENTSQSLNPSLYKKDFLASLTEMKREIQELKPKVAPGDTLSENAQLLKIKQEEFKFIEGHPAYQAALLTKNDRAWRRVLRKELDINSRSYAYQMLATNGRGLWSDETDFARTIKQENAPTIWHYPRGEWFDTTKLATLLATILMTIMVVYALIITRRREMYLRPIAGLEELDNAIGRATEMGRPVMFVPGWGTLGDPCTVSAMMILNQIAKKTAEYDIRLISPHTDYFVVPLAQEMVQSAYNEMGRPDAYNQNDIFFVSDVQFAFSAAVNGITIRDRIATIFYMGYFNAEALLMTETGNQSGAIQIAASDAITQIPFFITTCDYTLIGEEFYAAAAYLSHNTELVSMLKAQDYFKIVIVIAVLVGTVLSTLNVNALLNFLPVE